MLKSRLKNNKFCFGNNEALLTWSQYIYVFICPVPVLPIEVAIFVQKFYFFSDPSSFHFWCFNSERFLSDSKITFGNLHKLFHDIKLFIPDSTIFFILKRTKLKNGERFTKIWNLKNQESISHEIRSILHKFLRVSNDISRGIFILALR